jgi:uncharacterized protein (DUF1499 family)
MGVQVAMREKRRLLQSISIFLFAFLFCLGIRLMPSTKPSELGVIDEKLGGCPSSPNCVSTEDPEKSHQIRPLFFSGTPESALTKLVKILSQMPRTRLVTQKDNYLHFECRSRIFQFVDDLEFYVDPQAKTIQIRSASRVGYSDLGVNRKRVEKIRSAFVKDG